MRSGYVRLDLIAALTTAALAAMVALPLVLAARLTYNERSAVTSLKTLTTAEADFRVNDRDGNRSMDYWTADVYAFHGMIGITGPAKAPPKDEAESNDIIKLIEPSFAAADGRTDQALYGNQEFASAIGMGRPKRGYLFRALHNEVTGPLATTLLQDTDGADQFYGACHDHDRFAFVAFPTSLKAGKLMFVVNEDNTIWQLSLPASYNATYKGSAGAATDSTSTTAGEGLPVELTLSEASGQGTFPGAPRTIGLAQVKDEPKPDWGKRLKETGFSLSEAIDKAVKETKGGVVIQANLVDDGGKLMYLLDVAREDKTIDLRLDARDGGAQVESEFVGNHAKLIKPFKITLKQAIEAAEKKSGGKAVRAGLGLLKMPQIQVMVWKDGESDWLSVDGEDGSVME